MVRVVALFGSGDAYLVAALFAAFQRQHNREAVLVIKQKYACVAEMFGPAVRYVCDDALVERAQGDLVMQRDYDNVIADGRDFYAHPSFLRTNMRVDHLITRPDASQADMYRAILRVLPDAPLASPTPPAAATVPNKLVLIPDALSLPNLHPAFWDLLSARLSYAGWNVQNNRGSGWSLRDLFRHCAEAEWVIGPQCGVMSILVSGEFPCRKTFATSNIDGTAGWFKFRLRTFPYAYVTKFTNLDYDVEEFKIAGNTYDALVDNIVNGSNGLRLRPYDPAPVCSVMMPLSPGDLLDRFAVLTVKRYRFDKARRAAIEREYQRYSEAAELLLGSQAVKDLFEHLVATLDEGFGVLEELVPAVLNGQEETIETAKIHAAVIRGNKVRVDIKQKIDVALRGGLIEVKSYYG